MKTLKTHTWLRVGALAGLLALSPLVFSNGSNGEDLVQLNEATCDPTTCCPEEQSICITPTYHWTNYYDHGPGSCNNPE